MKTRTKNDQKRSFCPSLAVCLRPYGLVCTHGRPPCDRQTLLDHWKTFRNFQNRLGMKVLPKHHAVAHAIVGNTGNTISRCCSPLSVIFPYIQMKTYEHGIMTTASRRQHLEIVLPRSKFTGNAYILAVWFDESCNRLLANVARAAHATKVEIEVLTRFCTREVRQRIS